MDGPQFNGMTDQKAEHSVAEGDVEVVYSENPQGDLRRVSQGGEDEE